MLPILASFIHATHVNAQAITEDHWIALGGGEVLDNSVYATAVDGAGNLYVGGTLSEIGPDSVPVAQIAKWDGTAWSALRAGLTGQATRPIVWALAVSGLNLYAGGTFLEAGGQEAWRLAQWDGVS
ncbi:MAG: hypothetical protein H7A45_14290 [Verrucomicrobiales bacterium]|nr:hypothetical protein [Verrucomicrobiales bacterium]MCP5527263.1 hypothetical protein [Verrucomicrobiales bacterium]